MDLLTVGAVALVIMFLVASGDLIAAWRRRRSAPPPVPREFVLFTDGRGNYSPYETLTCTERVAVVHWTCGFCGKLNRARAGHLSATLMQCACGHIGGEIVTLMVQIWHLRMLGGYSFVVTAADLPAAVNLCVAHVEGNDSLAPDVQAALRSELKTWPPRFVVAVAIMPVVGHVICIHPGRPAPASPGSPVVNDGRAIKPAPGGLVEKE